MRKLLLATLLLAPLGCAHAVQRAENAEARFESKVDRGIAQEWAKREASCVDECTEEAGLLAGSPEYGHRDAHGECVCD